MENASKALMMAGALLITLMILAMAMYFFTQYSEFPERQEEAIKLAQTAKFNQEYESYYKKKMYGTDVVTIINKVISNNEKYADIISGKYLLDENNHFIDVEVTLLEEVKSYAEQYIEVSDMTYINQNNKAVRIETYNTGTITGLVNGDSTKKKSFKLGTVKLGLSGTTTKFNLLKEGNFEYFMNTSLVNFFSGDETYKIQITRGGYPSNKFDKFNYTLVHSGFTDFKRKFFECTGIEYNPETARVSKICFNEIDNEE